MMWIARRIWRSGSSVRENDRVCHPTASSSVIIPTLNESAHIDGVSRTCPHGDATEIIVADGGSRDTHG